MNTILVIASNELLGLGQELRGKSNSVEHFASLVTCFVFRVDKLPTKKERKEWMLENLQWLESCVSHRTCSVFKVCKSNR